MTRHAFLNAEACPRCGCWMAKPFKCNCGTVQVNCCANCGRYTAPALLRDEHAELSPFDYLCAIGRVAHSHPRRGLGSGAPTDGASAFVTRLLRTPESLVPPPGHLTRLTLKRDRSIQKVILRRGQRMPEGRSLGFGGRGPTPVDAFMRALEQGRRRRPI